MTRSGNGVSGRSTAIATSLVRRFVRTSVALLLVVSVAFVFPDDAHAQADALPYFNTYTIPGNYAVGGVDLVPLTFINGVRTRRISMSGVPANAEILAAFLYWETMWAGPPSVLGGLQDKVRFRGQPVSAIKTSSIPLNAPLGTCRGIGNAQTLSMMRADVLRLLPRQLDQNGEPTGRLLVNDADLIAAGLARHTVGLPDSGIFDFVPQSSGASLLVIYQDPNPSTPLRSIVVYDGAHIQAPRQDTQQKIRFLDAKNGSAARLTFIGGSGFANLTDRVFFGGSNQVRIDNGNPFPAGRVLTDRAWSNRTFNILANSWLPRTDPLFGEEVTARVTHTAPLLLYDCLSTAAIVFSTDAQDGDLDGLPDKLEDVSGLLNPAGVPYPDINGMGADSTVRDLFVEIGAMREAAGHDHMPSAAVLKQVGDALAVAAAGDPPRIAVHFDVGPTLAPAYAAASPYIIDAAYARGGESIQEQISGPTARFPGFPGVVSWPSGFQFLALAAVAPDGRELVGDEYEQWCPDPKQDVNCRRRFDLTRHGIFHYLMYVHARGVPKSDLPCLSAPDPMGVRTPIPFPPGTNMCAGGSGNDNPDYYIPKSVSGVAELPGKYAMVSLGLWDNEVGTESMQAQTTLHELGHNLGLWHGGAAPVFTPIAKGRVRVDLRPNCIPLYFSVMSYGYQATGVVNKDGNSLARLSDELTPGLNEGNGLQDGSFGLDALPYRPAWYTTQLDPDIFGDIHNQTPVKRHCDGTPLAGEPPTIRLDASFSNSSLNWLIDWDGDGAPDSASQDANFDGKLSSLIAHNDWSSLAPNRLGSGHAMAGFSIGLGLDFGGLDFGGLDFGGLDFGGLDFGGLDFGGLDFGGLDFGGLDFGGLDFGGLDFGGLDFGGLDFGGLDFGGLESEVGAELTYEIVLESILTGGTSGPRELKAFKRGTDGAGGTNSSVALGQTWVPPFEPTVCDDVDNPLGRAQCHRVRLDWTEPVFGVPNDYLAFRVFDPTGDADSPAPGSVTVELGPTDGPTTNLTDDEELPNGQRFIYWVRGRTVTDLGTDLGQRSNYAIITATNAAPVADEDEYDAPSTPTRQLIVDAEDGVLSNDEDIDSVPASLKAVVVEGPDHGTLLFNADGSFTYTPDPDFAGGEDSFTYKANNGTFDDGNPDTDDPPMSPDSNVVTVTINVPLQENGNEPPNGTDNTVETNINNDYVFDVDDFGFEDPDEDNFKAVKISTLPNPSKGKLFVKQGVEWGPVASGTFISVTQINAGEFKFEPVNGVTGQATFDFQVQDDSGAPNDLDDSPNTMTIDIIDNF